MTESKWFPEAHFFIPQNFLKTLPTHCQRGGGAYVNVSGHNISLSPLLPHFLWTRNTALSIINYDRRMKYFLFSWSQKISIV